MKTWEELKQPTPEIMARFVGDMWMEPGEGWDSYDAERQKCILDGVKEFFNTPEAEKPEHPHYGNYVWCVWWLNDLKLSDSPDSP